MSGKNKLPCRRELKRSILGILIYAITLLVLFLGFAGYIAFVYDHPLWAISVAAIIGIITAPLVTSYLMCLFRYNKLLDKDPWRDR